MMTLSEPHIRRTALSLLRAYGARAGAEARMWCRHFAETGDRRERLVWARVLVEIRRLRRGEPFAAAA